MSYQDRKEEIKSGHLLDVIRERPALYLGEHSITGLWHFLGGYHAALHVYEIETVDLLPRDFHEWVAYRLHYYESTGGWRRMILDRVPDESAALERFYELLDDHRARKPHVVATIHDYQVEYKTWSQGQDLSEAITRKVPDAMALVAYTDDPGLFLTSDSADDFPGKDRLFRPWRIKREAITVVDQDAFSRWLNEDPRAGRLPQPN